jgi:hypothetical protein
MVTDGYQKRGMFGRKRREEGGEGQLWPLHSMMALFLEKNEEK